MVLAVTAEGNEIFQHFGHTKMFKLFTVEDGKVVSRSDLDTSMSGHEALAVILRQNGISGRRRGYNTARCRRDLGWSGYTWRWRRENGAAGSGH